MTVKQNGCSEQEYLSASLNNIDYRFKKRFDGLKEILNSIPKPDVKNKTTKYKIIGKTSRLILKKNKKLIFFLSYLYKVLFFLVHLTMISY